MPKIISSIHYPSSSSPRTKHTTSAHANSHILNDFCGTRHLGYSESTLGSPEISFSPAQILLSCGIPLTTVLDFCQACLHLSNVAGAIRGDIGCLWDRRYWSGGYCNVDAKGLELLSDLFNLHLIAQMLFHVLFFLKQGNFLVSQTSKSIKW